MTLSTNDQFPSAPLLKICGINKSIVGVGDLLRNIDLTISPGDTVAITGPSGSGKSTLLHIMGGLVRADSGSIEIDATLPVSKSDWQKARTRDLCFVFQESWLLHSLTVADNVELPMLGVVTSAAERRGRIDELLTQLGLQSRAATLAAKLSGGERQRVALARALANRPRLILADEPTGSLDVANTELVSKILFDLCRNQRVALCLATHDQEVARGCARAYALDNGYLRPLQPVLWA